MLITAELYAAIAKDAGVQDSLGTEAKAGWNPYTAFFRRKCNLNSPKTKQHGSALSSGQNYWSFADQLDFFLRR
jgi:hypothetical protein